jgi:lysozyme
VYGEDVKINRAGLDLIKRFEGLRLEAYKCPAGVLTIGYGHTGDVEPGMKITEHQADVILGYDLEKFERGVTDLTEGIELNENEFSALVSFAFNTGLAALARSTLLSKIREGEPGVGEEFEKWVYGGGKKLPGLVARRAAERALFLTLP